jgi:TRAP-type C4-dicarboxylate transport system substrate-binding protein
MENKRIGVVGTFCIMLVLVIVGLATSGEKTTPKVPIILKICHAMPAGPSQKGIPALKLKELVETRTNGRVKVEIYPAAQLYKDPDALVAVSNGTIFGVITDYSPLSKWDKGFQVINMFGVFDNEDHLWRFIESDKGGKELERRLEKKGLILGWCAVGYTNLWTRDKPINRVDDLQGLKIRVMPAPILVDAVKAVFACDAIALGVADLYTAAQQGMIDGTITLPVSIRQRMLHEVFRYCMERPRFNYTSTNPVISKIQLNNLPSDIKKIVLDSFYEACKVVRPYCMADTTEEALKVMRAAGVKFTSMSAEEWAKVMKAYEPVRKKWTTIIGENLVDEAKNLR